MAERCPPVEDWVKVAGDLTTTEGLTLEEKRLTSVQFLLLSTRGRRIPARKNSMDQRCCSPAKPGQSRCRGPGYRDKGEGGGQSPHSLRRWCEWIGAWATEMIVKSRGQEGRSDLQS
ncbi:hypothetical protein AOLI_G00192630 [Acnodon oligacanthus]